MFYRRLSDAIRSQSFRDAESRSNSDRITVSAPLDVESSLVGPDTIGRLVTEEETGPASQPVN